MMARRQTDKREKKETKTKTSLQTLGEKDRALKPISRHTKSSIMSSSLSCPPLSHSSHFTFISISFTLLSIYNMPIIEVRWGYKGDDKEYSFLWRAYTGRKGKQQITTMH